MLQTILETVRNLLDEAYAADQLRHATTLSKLTNTLEAAVLHADEINERYVERDRIVAVISNMVGRFLDIAKSRLTEDEHEVVAGVFMALIPPPLPVDPSIESITKELGYVRAAFDKAVADKAVGEVNRLAQSAVSKCKLLLRYRLKAGELIDQGTMRAMVDRALDATKQAKAATRKPEIWDIIVDEWTRKEAAVA